MKRFLFIFFAIALTQEITATDAASGSVFTPINKLYTSLRQVKGPREQEAKQKAQQFFQAMGTLPEVDDTELQKNELRQFYAQHSKDIESFVAQAKQDFEAEQAAENQRYFNQVSLLNGNQSGNIVVSNSSAPENTGEVNAFYQDFSSNTNLFDSESFISLNDSNENDNNQSNFIPGPGDILPIRNYFTSDQNGNIDIHPHNHLKGGATGLVGSLGASTLMGLSSYGLLKKAALQPRLKRWEQAQATKKRVLIGARERHARKPS
jgi:hypothetical protein